MTRSRELIETDLLALKAKRGDAEALDQLLRQWQTPLWRHLRGLCRDDQTAWDLLQETCLSIARAIRELKRTEAFPAMAYRIARRRYADWVRSDSRQRRTIDAVADRDQEVGRDSHARPTDEAQKIRDAVARLDDEHRIPIRLAYMEGFAYQEIADMLELPVGTVKSRIFHAKECIRREIEKEERP